MGAVILPSQVYIQQALKQKLPPNFSGSLLQCASSEIRTRVLALKGLRPGPLDDGGVVVSILSPGIETVKELL